MNRAQKRQATLMKKQGKGILDGLKSLVSKGEELAKKYRPARAINTYLRD